MRLGFPDRIIEHASQSLLLRSMGLMQTESTHQVRDFVASKFSFEPVYAQDSGQWSVVSG